jgi:hypothetical protein
MAETCPECGGSLEPVRWGKRRFGTVSAAGGELPEHGIPSTAKCQSCGRLWDRDWHDDEPMGNPNAEWRPSKIRTEQDPGDDAE